MSSLDDSFSELEHITRIGAIRDLQILIMIVVNKSQSIAVGNFLTAPYTRKLRTVSGTGR